MPCSRKPSIYHSFAVDDYHLIIIFNGALVFHRYFIEPISETSHIIFHIYKRFVKFLSQMTSSRKGILRSLCNVVMNDCQSTTGRNLRRLQLLFNSGSFTELQRDVTNRAYQEADVNDLWKIEAVKDLTEAMYDNAILPNFTRNEISD